MSPVHFTGEGQNKTSAFNYSHSDNYEVKEEPILFKIIKFILLVPNRHFEVAGEHVRGYQLDRATKVALRTAILKSSVAVYS